MDFETYQFRGITGFILAVLMVILSPVILGWGAAMDIMGEMERQENRTLAPKEKLVFYGLGVYAVLCAIAGICASGYGLFVLVSWLASTMSS